MPDVNEAREGSVESAASGTPATIAPTGARLVYLMNVSLDGFVATPDGRTDWGTVDEELFGWFTDQLRAASALLYGRRLYETMEPHWPGAAADPDATPSRRTFGEIWTAKPKVVFSSTLTDVAHNARLVRADPIAELARVRSEFDGELHLGGPTLAATFVRHGVVDVYRLVVHPVVLGAGKRFWPALDGPISLQLVETHSFASGAIVLEYARPGGSGR
jgi:dihydrofolate reductase